MSRCIVVVAMVTEEDDARLVGPNAPQILRSLPPRTGLRAPPMEAYIRDVIVDLLNALVVKVERPQPEAASKEQEKKKDSSSKFVIASAPSRVQHQQAVPGVFSVSTEEDDTQETPAAPGRRRLAAGRTARRRAAPAKAEDAAKKTRPLLRSRHLPHAGELV
ncbi:PREDICTED: uncharacterized protein LOC106816861 [Priapulus caudatus]|uniref:Uncharacterized protein LOC106816861 n=1 Tax=Priapulus caudatus TaxID=37621 RepID=A0ABM1EXR9_PRICU|nr:PREDICTED: uncharacterized protein LOC106816861 [Priapulus caudatus]